jgi:hypothetical protein
MASLQFSPQDIIPLVQKLGLGNSPVQTEPNAMDADHSQQGPLPPAPPPPLPPTPAGAGFNAWAADPKNQEKIAGGITAPGQPLVSPTTAAQFGSVAPMAAPAAAAPAAPAAPITQAADMAANPTAYQKNSLKGRGWGRALAIGGVGALQSLASGLTKGGDPLKGMDFVNQQVQHDEGVPAANAGIYDVRNIKPLRDAAALADTQSQTAQRNAAAARGDSQADAGAPFIMTADQAAAIGHPELVGMKTNTTQYTKALTAATGADAKVTVGAGNNAAATTVGAGHDTARVTVGAGNNATSAANNAATNATRETVEQMANKTRILVTGMNNATSRANNENTVANKGTVGGGGYKVPADVTKRAALAANVNENADGVTEIIGRRPDIVGSMGGRYTNVQQMIGSNDPDIQALGVRIHNMALAGNGAHGVRSAKAVNQTENELFNNFKTGPKGIAGAIAATRGSVQTFLNDEKSFQTSGNRTGTTPGGSISVTAPDGSVHPFATQAQANQFKKLAGIK